MVDPSGDLGVMGDLVGVNFLDGSLEDGDFRGDLKCPADLESWGKQMNVEEN